MTLLLLLLLECQLLGCLALSLPLPLPLVHIVRWSGGSGRTCSWRWRCFAVHAEDAGLHFVLCGRARCRRRSLNGLPLLLLLMLVRLLWRWALLLLLIELLLWLLI